MSEYEQYLKEKQQLEVLVALLYKITSVKENLSGAYVHLENAQGETAILHLETANARKYLGTVLIQQESSA
ncbi:hypothetical protein [Paenibacillus aestuarii]|uniref:DUF2642 domain-containing protein n=1 Tax=Paenibacillus aestuarii TaxID=516965 RepID=A0ABW0K6N6_9BACL|nr:hypothetical protein [Paenibacillus aestuarii]